MNHVLYFQQHSRIQPVRHRDRSVDNHFNDAAAAVPGKWTHSDNLKWINSRTLLLRQDVPLFKVSAGILSALLLTKGFVLLKVSPQTFKSSCGERTAGVSRRNPGQCSLFEDFVLRIVRVLCPAFIHLWSWEKFLLTLPEQLCPLRDHNMSWSALPLWFLHECFLNRQWHKG